MKQNRKTEIAKATTKDIERLVRFYDELTVFLEDTVNYPVWKKDVYPARHNITAAVAGEELFVLTVDEDIAAAVILNNSQPPEYAYGNWAVKAKDSEILVVHAMGVHYNFYRCGLASRMMEFVCGYAEQCGAKTVRLDAAVGNKPAITLYEKIGYTYVGETVLQPENEGDIPVRLYELPL